MKRKPTFTSSLGSISDLYDETTEDHIDSLAHELRCLMKRCRVGREDRKRFNRLLLWCEFYANGSPTMEKRAGELVGSLCDALETFAPPHCVFGASGSNYGFWPILNDELPKLEAGLDHRDYWGDDVLLVNDHGNASCGRFDKRGQFHEYWAIV